MLTKEFHGLAQDYAAELEKIRNEKTQIEAQIKTIEALIQIQKQEHDRLNAVKMQNKSKIDALTTENDKVKRHIELKRAHLNGNFSG